MQKLTLASMGVICLVLLLSGTAQSQDNVSPYDVKRAEMFLDDLPDACKKNSTMATLLDGTVKIYVSCKDGKKSTKGEVEIKGGVVKKIK